MPSNVEQEKRSPVLVRTLGWIAGITGIGAVVFLVLLVVVEAVFKVQPADDDLPRMGLLLCVVTWFTSWVAWAALDGFLVDDDGRWAVGSGVGKVVRLTTAGALLALALVVPLATVEIYAENGAFDDSVGAAAGLLAGVLVIGALVAGAIGGAVVLGGWRWAALGLVLVAGIVALAVGLTEGKPGVALAGGAGLAVATFGYYLIGSRAGVVPAGQRNVVLPVAGLLGGVLVVWGAVAPAVPTLIFGVFLLVLTVASYLGVAYAERGR